MFSFKYLLKLSHENCVVENVMLIDLVQTFSHKLELTNVRNIEKNIKKEIERQFSLLVSCPAFDFFVYY